MELLTDTLPLQAPAGTHASENFMHPLLELETYVTQRRNEKLTDSFLKFREALTETGPPLKHAIAINTPDTLPTATASPVRSYLAMSSLFSANVKDY